MSDQNQTPATATPAATEAPAKSRTQAFTRDFKDFTGPVILTPTEEISKLGVKPLSYDAANIPGFSTMPKGARIILCRAIADQLTQIFAATMRGNKDDGPGTPAQAVDEMGDCFTSIVEGTFTYGRTGTGAGRVQGVALTAALMVAVNYSLDSRDAAMAHPHYGAIKERLAAMLSQAETLDEQAEAVALPACPEDAAGKAKWTEENADAIKRRATLEAQATGLRAAYQQVARTPEVQAMRAKWYPPKAKEQSKPAVTVASLFAGLGDAPV